VFELNRNSEEYAIYGSSTKIASASDGTVTEIMRTIWSVGIGVVLGVECDVA
jgi:hypothetical protein